MKKIRRYPLIVGHRGTSLYPENTLLAFREAIKSGADVVECDLRLTKDKKLVVFHDATVDKLTNGSGFIKNKTLKSLKQLRIQGEPIPTFDEVLHEIKGKAKLIVEIKTLGVEGKMIRALKRHKMLKHTIVLCFSHPLVYKIKLLNKNVKTAIGIGSMPMDAVEMAKKAKADVIVSYFEALVAGYHLNKWMVRKAHKNNIQVFSCPVRIEELLSSTEIKRLLGLGLDGIIVNRPDRLRQLFDLKIQRKSIKKLLARFKT